MADQTQELTRGSSRTQTGPIIVARHGRPALDRTKGPRLNWREYKDWWSRYEAGGLAEKQDAPQILKDLVKGSDVVLASSRQRSMETARLAAPWAENIESSDLFWEANLPPPRWEKVRFLPKTWNILARAAWLRGHKLDGEGVREAEARAERAADCLIERAKEGQVFLAAHGWFNRMLRPRLRARGWVCVLDGGDAYWSYRVYEYRPKSASRAQA
tara:strand:- start:6294 stop:6938 length:645 start_codon:yes stop_codon:yes gene_type:complete